jgi:hypothetical protein
MEQKRLTPAGTIGRSLAFFLLLALGCLVAQDLRADLLPSLSYRMVRGNNDYMGHTFLLDYRLPLGFYVGGSYSAYDSSLTNGTYQNFYGAGGWGGEIGSFYLHGSGVPVKNGYKNSSVGFDSSLKVLSLGGGSDGSGSKNLKLYLLLGYDRGMQKDADVSLINENDYMGGAKIQWHGTSLVSKFIKNTYQGDNFQTSRPLKLEGIAAFQQGYPDQTFYSQISQDILSIVWVYGSYSNVKYKFGGASPYVNAYTAGLGIDLKLVRASAEYSQIVPQAGAIDNCLSFGLSLAIF